MWGHSAAARKSPLAPECLVADAVRFEPVSDAEMGKIMGKTHKLPPANERNAENPCGTGTSDDSEVQK